MSRALTPMKVVFDCIVFLQATANEESSAANALDLLDTGEIKLYVSEHILEEVRNVLGREEVRAALPQITDVRIEALFRRLNKKAILARRVPRVFEFSRDTSDEPYLNLAIAINAAFLVSRDRDLLDLKTDSESKQFRRRFRFLKVITPDDFLKEVERARDMSGQRIK
jgi:putative PIN family toxin of toxin-antitoxin system